MNFKNYVALVIIFMLISFSGCELTYATGNFSPLQIEGFKCMEKCSEDLSKKADVRDTDYLWCYEKVCGCEARINEVNCFGRAYEDYYIIQNREKENKNGYTEKRF